jgi:hypothetical protein
MFNWGICLFCRSVICVIFKKCAYQKRQHFRKYYIMNTWNYCETLIIGTSYNEKKNKSNTKWLISQKKISLHYIWIFLSFLFLCIDGTLCVSISINITKYIFNAKPSANVVWSITEKCCQYGWHQGLSGKFDKFIFVSYFAIDWHLQNFWKGHFFVT